jgi:myo-inositol-1(or 4)-monophosphatase
MMSAGYRSLMMGQDGAMTSTAPLRIPLVDLLALHPLLPMAWQSALKAGAFLLNERPEDLTVDSKSTPTDLVSAMDRSAEEMIIDGLLGPRPDDGFLGEEGGERIGTSGVRWVVDPLDGTVNYLFGFPMWGVSIGMEQDGVTEIGVISTPAFDEHYIAVRGQGAWLIRGEQGTRLSVKKCADLSLAMIVTGFGYAPERRVSQAAVVQELIAQVRDIRRLGAAVVDFAWLAQGRFDAYYERGLNAWDISAGMLLAAEAGAEVSFLRGGEPSDLLVAVVPGIAHELRAELLRLDADLGP